MPRDLKHPRWMYLKAILLLAIGLIASLLILLDQPTLRTAALLAVAIWAFCRFYYFAFYVIEHYIDSQYRFAGLLDFAMYLVGRKQATKAVNEDDHREEQIANDQARPE